jgi:hypothetical protein
MLLSLMAEITPLNFFFSFRNEYKVKSSINLLLKNRRKEI